MAKLSPLARRIFLGVMIGILLLALADLNSRIMEMTRLDRELARVAVQSTAIMATNVAAKEKVVEATSEAIVREWAYTTGRYIEPGKGENLVVIIPSGADSAKAAPVPTEEQKPLENWQVWWALFFDAPMP